jgi:hypothetical protein
MKGFTTNAPNFYRARTKSLPRTHQLFTANAPSFYHERTK